MNNIADAFISPINMDVRRKLDIRAGDTVKVWQKIQEKGKTRLQVFEGIVLARKHGREAGGTFTVRKVTGGIGVEKIFPLYSPMIDKIEIVRRSKVRRSKLYHIREKASKEIKRQMRNIKNLPDVSDTEEEEKKVEAEAKEDLDTNSQNERPPEDGSASGGNDTNDIEPQEPEEQKEETPTEEPKVETK